MPVGSFSKTWIQKFILYWWVHSYITSFLLGSKQNWTKTQCHNVYCFWETDAFFLAFPHNDCLHVQCNLWCNKGLSFKLLNTLICGIWFTVTEHTETLLLCLGPSFCTCSNLGQIVYSNISVQRGSQSPKRSPSSSQTAHPYLCYVRHVFQGLLKLEFQSML